MNKPLKPATTSDLREQVYLAIKSAIVDGRFKPGQKLSEFDLAQQLNVSRTPVREAIRQLAKTGLVMLVPRKGAFVTRPTQDDAIQLCELRQRLEGYVVELIAQNPPVEKLQAYRRQFLQMDSHTPKELYLEADRNFHLFLYDQSGNRFLRDTLLDLLDLINLYRPYSLIDSNSLVELATEHVNVIDAILDANKNKAEKEMRDHIKHNENLLINALS